jgi:AraC family ethanolamine operon transcriptional activator
MTPVDTPPPMSLRTVVTRDVDDQAASLEGWQQTYEQLSAGPFAGRTIQARLSDSLSFLRESTNRRLVERTVPPARTHTFAMFVSAGGDVRFNDVRMPADALISTPGSVELTVCVPENTEVAALEVADHELAGYATVFGEAAAGTDIRVGPRVTRSAMTPMLRGFLDQVLAVCSDTPHMLAHEQTQRSLKSAAISNILFALSGSGAEAGGLPVTAQRRYQLVQQARSHIDAQLGDVFTVADVCRALGVSRRTLQYCFEDVLQINPIAYIRAMRLNAARRDLKRADPVADTVADIASRWGFWHLGHFSADYKRMFGELPSATLHGA